VALWLESILKQIEQVTDDQVPLAEPASPVTPVDIVVGVASIPLRKLLYLKSSFAKRAYGLRGELELCPIDQRRRLATQYTQTTVEAGLLEELFWASCRNEFPQLWAYESIGVRAGWQVVGTHEVDSLSSLMERLGGDPDGGLFGKRSGNKIVN